MPHRGVHAAATSTVRVGIVVAMIGADDPGTGPEPDPRAINSGRSWTHPSEVGMAHRGRTDRRRTTLIASGVLIGGVCLLLSGFVMGEVDRTATATSVTAPRERALGSVALITAVAEGATHSATGVVLDDRGRVLVGSAAVDDADELWVRCTGGDLQQARVIASDPVNDMSVLEVAAPAGVPVTISRHVPADGTRLQMVQAGPAADVSVDLEVGERDEPEKQSRSEHAPKLIDLTWTSGSSTFTARADGPLPLDDPHGAMVFDRSGRLAGVVVSEQDDRGHPVLSVAAADDIADAAVRLLSQHD